MSDKEPTPTPEELAEARALAAALEGAADPPAPGDVLETAALLGAARTGGALPDLRREALRKRLEPLVAARGGRSRARRWTGAAGALLVAAVVTLVLFGRRPGPGLPRPGVELLQAQAAAAVPGSPAGAQALAARMQPYRRELLAALARRYGGER